MTDRKQLKQDFFKAVGIASEDKEEFKAPKDWDDLILFANNKLGFSIKRDYPKSFGFKPAILPDDKPNDRIMVRVSIKEERQDGNLIPVYIDIGNHDFLGQQYFFHEDAPEKERPITPSQGSEPQTIVSRGEYSYDTHKKCIVKDNKKQSFQKILDSFTESLENADIAPNSIAYLTSTFRGVQFGSVQAAHSINLLMPIIEFPKKLLVYVSNKLEDVFIFSIQHLVESTNNVHIIYKGRSPNGPDLDIVADKRARYEFMGIHCSTTCMLIITAIFSLFFWCPSYFSDVGFLETVKAKFGHSIAVFSLLFLIIFIMDLFVRIIFSYKIWKMLIHRKYYKKYFILKSKWPNWRAVLILMILGLGIYKFTNSYYAHCYTNYCAVEHSALKTQIIWPALSEVHE